MCQTHIPHRKELSSLWNFSTCGERKMTMDVLSASHHLFLTFRRHSRDKEAKGWWMWLLMTNWLIDVDSKSMTECLCMLRWWTARSFDTPQSSQKREIISRKQIGRAQAALRHHVDDGCSHFFMLLQGPRCSCIHTKMNHQNHSFVFRSVPHCCVKRMREPPNTWI